MATSTSRKTICNLVYVRTLELKVEGGRKPDYNGVVVTEDTLLVIDGNARNLQIYNRHDGKLCTSHELESIPTDVCLISKTEVAVCLVDCKIVILSLKSIHDVKPVKTLDVMTGFYRCDSVAKLNSDKLVVSGRKGDDGIMLYWCVVNLTDGSVDSTHKICKGDGDSHLAIKDNTVYISCWTLNSTTTGVYAYDIFNPHTHKFLYQHQELKYPWSIMADRDYVYVCDLNSNRIHQLTDSGQLVTIHTMSSRPNGIFYDDQHGVLYATSRWSNVITVYRLEYSHQPGIPAEILNMDDRSIQLFEEALKDGKERVYNIRIMVVGHFGVGKTTLVKRLLEEEVNISERCNTEGIDVHVNCCDVSLSTHEWTRRTKDSEQDYRLQHLARVLNEQQLMKDKATCEKQVKVLPQGEITHKSYEVAHIADEDKESEVLYSSSQQDISHDLSSTASQQVESSPSLAQREPIQSETNIIAMLKLLQENVYQLKQETDKTLPLTVWDLADQYVFYTTHQMFPTSQAIYLLVSDLSKQLTDLVADECYFDCDGKMKCKVHEVIEFWLNSIHYCTPSPNTSIPPVILVGTHMDKMSQSGHYEIQEVCKKYFREICTCLRNNPSRFHLVNEDFALDNTVFDRRLEDLKRKIVEVASQQPYCLVEIPARWIPLEQKLMRLKEAGVKVIPISLLKEMNRTGVVPLSADELDLFLRFEHAFGTILYFSLDVLREKLVLEPQWLIDALKSLINADKMFILRLTKAVTEKWFEFKTKGKLYPELIDAIWTKERNQDFYISKEYLLQLMEQLNIIVKPRSYTKDGKEIKQEDYYLVPCMLRQAMPREIIFPESDPEMESTPVLCFMYVGNILPPPIFHRLVGACLTHWPIAKKRSENRIYCGCCVFDLDLHHRLNLYFRGRIIFARVSRMGVKDSTLTTELCSKARELIFENLSKIIGNQGQSLQFVPYIKCPDSNPNSLEGLIAVSLLQQNEYIVCPSHEKSHKHFSRHLLQYWFEKEKKMDSSEEIHSKLSELTIHEGTQMSLQERALPQVAFYTLTLELSKDGNILHETESKIIAYLDRGHIVFDYDMVSQCLKWEHGSVIIHLRPLKKLTKERLAFFCQYGGMKNYLLDLLKQKDIFSSLPEGEMSMQVQVHCYDEDLESKGADGRDKEHSQKISKQSLSQYNSFTITENPQVIKQNLLLQYNDMVDEIEPVLFQETFVAKGICDISFFEELKMGSRKERTTHFLNRVLDKGETALAALAHTLRKNRMYYLFNRLCIAKEISSQYIHKGVPCSDPKLLCQILNKSQQAASSSQSTLEVNCQSVGLELHGETPANGNCFFEAVSSQLQRLNCGIRRSPQQLRQEVVAFMRTTRVLHTCEGTINLDGFIYNETYDDYCTRMARDGEWADHVVVVAMARKLQMDIFIVTSSPSSGPDDIIVWVVGQTGFMGMPILLGHIWESHYLSLQPIGHVDDSLIKIVQEDSTTQVQEPMLWSCQLVFAVRKNDDGTPQITSTERAEKSIEAKKKHNKLCITLDGLITKYALKNIKRMAETYLDPKTVERVKSMNKLFSCLEEKEVISVGHYDKLIEIMTLAGVERGKDEIQKTAKDINDIMQHYIPSQAQRERSSLEAHTSQQDSIYNRTGNKIIPVSESTSDSISDSNSESESSSYSESQMASHQHKRKKKRKKDKMLKLKKKQKKRKKNPSNHSDAEDQ